MAGVAVHKFPIPSDNIVRALESAAVAGFHGQVRIELTVQPQAVEGVQFAITRISTGKPGAAMPREEVPASKMPDRARAVREMVDGIQDRLMLTSKVMAIVGHFADGRLLKYEVAEDSP